MCSSDLTANSEVETLEKKLESDSRERTTLASELEKSKSQLEKSQNKIQATEKKVDELHKTLESTAEEKDKLQTQSWYSRSCFHEISISESYSISREILTHEQIERPPLSLKFCLLKQSHMVLRREQIQMYVHMIAFKLILLLFIQFTNYMFRHIMRFQFLLWRSCQLLQASRSKL